MTWRKGESGNPGGLPGRPPNRSFAHFLTEELEKERAGLTNREAIAQKAVQMARSGNLEAMKWIADRVDGKVPERVLAAIEPAELVDDALRLEVLVYAARQRALERGA